MFKKFKRDIFVSSAALIFGALISFVVFSHEPAKAVQKNMHTYQVELATDAGSIVGRDMVSGETIYLQRSQLDIKKGGYFQAELGSKSGYIRSVTLINGVSDGSDSK